MADDHEHEHHHHDEDEGLIVLTDESGHDHQFEIIDVIEVDDREYAILVPAEGEELEEDDEGEAVILRLETDAEGEEILVDIDDDAEWERVAGAWEALLEEEEEDEE